MNSLECKMLEALKRLKGEYGALAVKVEFESEGTRTEELLRLVELVFKADMKLFIKIGGCEAITDLNLCKLFGADAIVAPMIESPFAVKKFIKAAHKVYGNELSEIKWMINLETKTARENVDSILDAGKDFLSAVAIGRSDLAASMELDKSAVNSDEIFSATKYLMKKAKSHGLIVSIGGNVNEKIIPFLSKMNEFPDRIETRKIVFAFDGNTVLFKKAILAALRFEMMYLENNISLCSAYSRENHKRLLTLKERITHNNQNESGGGSNRSLSFNLLFSLMMPSREESGVAA